RAEGRRSWCGGWAEGCGRSPGLSGQRWARPESKARPLYGGKSSGEEADDTTPERILRPEEGRLAGSNQTPHHSEPEPIPRQPATGYEERTIHQGLLRGERRGCRDQQHPHTGADRTRQLLSFGGSLPDLPAHAP